MKLGLTLLSTLLIATQTLHAGATRVVSQEELGSKKSALVRGNEQYPLGETQAVRMLWNLHEMGFRNLVVELPARISIQHGRDVVAFGHLRPGTQQQLRTFVKQAHSQDFTVSFKLVLVDQDGRSIGDYKPQNIDSFTESYRQYLSAYAKVAESAEVEEFVLGSNLTSFICDSSKSANLIYRNLARIFKGRVRLDSKSLNDSRNVQLCAEANNMTIHSYGVDLVNPDASQVVEVLADGRQVSSLAITGDSQSQSAQILRILNAVPLEKLTGLTFSYFSPDPRIAGLYESSESISGKSTEEGIKQWFKLF